MSAFFEIQAAIAFARRYSNINAIVVGNETQLCAPDANFRSISTSWSGCD